ncbi:unnamed protein product [Sympodiomycopsis kandeliae]
MADTQSSSAPAPTNGNGNGAAAATKKYNVEIEKQPGSHGKPDKSHHDGEMDRLKKEIEKVQAQVNDVRSLLSGGGPSTNTPQGKRRAELRAELDELRGAQAGAKGARGKVLDELKALQEGTNKKVKDLQQARSKAPYKTVTEIDSAISRLQSQVESGTLKIVDEKRALAEITSLRKSRKGVEAFESQQKVIDGERSRADELRKGLDSPEGRKLSSRYDEIKKELDGIQAEFEKSAGNRNKLIEKRTALSSQLDDLYGERRERSQAYRDAHDAWYARSQAEREKRLEAQRAEKKAYEDSKRLEQEQIMREEAALPAFAKEIEDCDVLISYFSGSKGTSTSTSTEAKSTVPGAKKLEPRKVDSDTSSFGQAVKKKGDVNDVDSYFIGGGGKKTTTNNKQKKKGIPLDLTPESNGSKTTDLKIPVGHLTALLSLSIPPPSSQQDIPRVVDNLKLKRRYFVENQDAKTKQRIEEVEKRLGKAEISEKEDVVEKA